MAEKFDVTAYVQDCHNILLHLFPHYLAVGYDAGSDAWHRLCGTLLLHLVIGRIGDDDPEILGESYQYASWQAGVNASSELYMEFPEPVQVMTSTVNEPHSSGLVADYSFVTTANLPREFIFREFLNPFKPQNHIEVLSASMGESPELRSNIRVVASVASARYFVRRRTQEFSPSGPRSKRSES